MSQTIKLKRGTTTPTTSDLVSGEVAIDTEAQRLYVNDAGEIKGIGGDYLNVKDFGAKGDGTQDETDEIQSAINYAAKNDIGTVFFPDGHYVFTKLYFNYRNAYEVPESTTQSTFAYDFEADNADDLEVKVAGSVTTAFTITGAGNIAGGTITLTTAATAGQKVIITSKSRRSGRIRLLGAGSINVSNLRRIESNGTSMAAASKEKLYGTVLDATGDGIIIAEDDDEQLGGIPARKWEAEHITFIANNSGAVITAMSCPDMSMSYCSVKQLGINGDGVVARSSWFFNMERCFVFGPTDVGEENLDPKTNSTGKGLVGGTYTLAGEWTIRNSLIDTWQDCIHYVEGEFVNVALQNSTVQNALRYGIYVEGGTIRQLYLDNAYFENTKKIGVNYVKADTDSLRNLNMKNCFILSGSRSSAGVAAKFISGACVDLAEIDTVKLDGNYVFRPVGAFLNVTAPRSNQTDIGLAENNTFFFDLKNSTDFTALDQSIDLFTGILPRLERNQWSDMENGLFQTVPTDPADTLYREYDPDIAVGPPAHIDARNAIHSLGSVGYGRLGGATAVDSSYTIDEDDIGTFFNFEMASTRAIFLPDGSRVPEGRIFVIQNDPSSTGDIGIRNYSEGFTGATIGTIKAGKTMTFIKGAGSSGYFALEAPDTDVSALLPKSGGTMTGELQVNARLDVGDGSGADDEIRIYKKGNSTSDHLQFFHNTTAMGEIGCHDTTWLRINQHTAKNIYTPRYIRADGGFFVDGDTKGINGFGNFVGGTITGASDANVANWDTAYGWGDHSTAGYLTSSSTIDADTLGGQALSAFTLDNVCDRGTSTNQGITVGGLTTAGTVQSGSGSGGVALTVNDGYGNANVTFNHRSGTPEQDGQSARIEVNTDSTTGAGSMSLEVSSAAVTSGTPVSLSTGLKVEPTSVEIPSLLTHAGDTNTYLQFTDDRVRLVAGGTTKFDSNNSYWHSGNDGSGSGLDADLLDGQHGSYYYPASNPNGYTSNVGDITNVTAGTSLSGGGTSGSVTLNVATPTDAPSGWRDVVGWDSALIKDAAVELHGSGYLRAAYLNMTHAATTRNSDTVFYSSTDDYVRKNNATGMRSSLNVPTRTGGDASGTWGINITGSAGTLDGIDSSQFLRSDANDTLSNVLKITGANSGLIYEKSASGGYVPVLAQYISSAGSVTGAIKIAFPVDGAADMMCGWVDIFDYGAKESVSVFIGGYLYQSDGSNEWANETAIVHTTNSNRNFTVRFGHDGTNNCIYIGELNTAWSYPQITCRDWTIGFSADIDAYATGTTISFEASAFQNVDATLANNNPIASDADTLDGYQSSASATANTVVLRNGSADIFTRLLRSTYPSQTSAPSTSARIAFRNDNGSSDNYIRTMTNTAFVSWMNAQSGLDADTLDGQHGSYYYPASNPNGYTSNTGDITNVTAGDGLSGGGTSGSVSLAVDSSVARTTGDTFTGQLTMSNALFNCTRNNNNVQLNRTSTTGKIQTFRYNGSEKGFIQVLGGSVNYSTTSDRRLKENIVDAPSASNLIDQIQVRSFDWKESGEHQQFGMVAQELQQVAPEAVATGDTEEDMMGVDYSKLVPMLVKEIQELRARVAELESK